MLKGFFQAVRTETRVLIGKATEAIENNKHLAEKAALTIADAEKKLKEDANKLGQWRARIEKMENKLANVIRLKADAEAYYEKMLQEAANDKSATVDAEAACETVISYEEQIEQLNASIASMKANEQNYLKISKRNARQIVTQKNALEALKTRLDTAEMMSGEEVTALTADFTNYFDKLKERISITEHTRQVEREIAQAAPGLNNASTESAVSYDISSKAHDRVAADLAKMAEESKPKNKK